MTEEKRRFIKEAPSTQGRLRQLALVVLERILSEARRDESADFYP